MHILIVWLFCGISISFCMEPQNSMLVRVRRNTEQGRLDERNRRLNKGNIKLQLHLLPIDQRIQYYKQIQPQVKHIPNYLGTENQTPQSVFMSKSNNGKQTKITQNENSQVSNKVVDKNDTNSVHVSQKEAIDFTTKKLQPSNIGADENATEIEQRKIHILPNFREATLKGEAYKKDLNIERKLRDNLLSSVSESSITDFCKQSVNCKPTKNIVDTSLKINRTIKDTNIKTKVQSNKISKIDTNTEIKKTNKINSSAYCDHKLKENPKDLIMIKADFSNNTELTKQSRELNDSRKSISNRDRDKDVKKLLLTPLLMNQLTRANPNNMAYENKNESQNRITNNNFKPAKIKSITYKIENYTELYKHHIPEDNTESTMDISGFEIEDVYYPGVFWYFTPHFDVLSNQFYTNGYLSTKYDNPLYPNKVETPYKIYKSCSNMEIIIKMADKTSDGDNLDETNN